jgi:hypothetical protein
MSVPLDYKGLEIIPALPSGLHLPEGDEEIFRRLVGCKITGIGSTANADIEGGGLLIDYTLPDSELPQRLVFAFNELGMWTIWDSLAAQRGRLHGRVLSEMEVREQFRDDQLSERAARLDRG